MAVRVGSQGFRRAHAHHLASASAAFRPHVDQPVGGLDDVQVVLDHGDGVAGAQADFAAAFGDVETETPWMARCSYALFFLISPV